MPEEQPPSIAELTAFVHVLLSDCIVTRCDDGLYIVCRARPRGGAGGAGGAAVDGEGSFAIGQGELAAHIRATTDVGGSEAGGGSGVDEARSQPDSEEDRDEDSDEDSSSSSSSSDDGDDSDDGEYESRAQVVVNVGRARARKRRKR